MAPKLGQANTARAEEERALDIVAEAENVCERLRISKRTCEKATITGGGVATLRTLLEYIHTMSDLESRAGGLDLRKIADDFLLAEAQCLGLQMPIKVHVVYGERRTPELEVLASPVLPAVPEPQVDLARRDGEAIGVVTGVRGVLILGN